MLLNGLLLANCQIQHGCATLLPRVCYRAWVRFSQIRLLYFQLAPDMKWLFPWRYGGVYIHANWRFPFLTNSQFMEIAITLDSFHDVCITCSNARIFDISSFLRWHSHKQTAKFQTNKWPLICVPKINIQCLTLMIEILQLIKNGLQRLN